MANELDDLKAAFPNSPGMFTPTLRPEVDAAIREAFPATYREAPPPADPPAEHRDSTTPPSTVGDFRAQVARWEEQARADADFGGPRFEHALASARSIIERYGDAELRDVLNTTGVGNHRALIRLLAKIAGDR